MVLEFLEFLLILLCVLKIERSPRVLSQHDTAYEVLWSIFGTAWTITALAPRDTFTRMRPLLAMRRALRVEPLRHKRMSANAHLGMICYHFSNPSMMLNVLLHFVKINVTLDTWKLFVGQLVLFNNLSDVIYSGFDIQRCNWPFIPCHFVFSTCQKHKILQLLVIMLWRSVIRLETQLGLTQIPCLIWAAR